MQLAVSSDAAPRVTSAHRFAQDDKGESDGTRPPAIGRAIVHKESGLVAAHLLPNEAVQSRDENDEKCHLEQVELD
jgi:hypothetical protein